MELAVPFDTPHDAALAVRGCARSVGVDLFLLPYQPLNNEAPWWLSPRSENPGYRYGTSTLARNARGVLVRSDPPKVTRAVAWMAEAVASNEVS
jgi:hypothetical protein